jgi:ABC-type transporter Mla subunit MlaD
VEFHDAAAMAKELAEGDWRNSVKDRGDLDKMNSDLNSMLNQVNETLHEINESVKRGLSRFYRPLNQFRKIAKNYPSYLDELISMPYSYGGDCCFLLF